MALILKGVKRIVQDTDIGTEMRIASLLPSTTELACALGLEDQLVGVSHECDFPASVKTLPHLTSSIIPHGLSQREIDNFVREAVQQGRSLYNVDIELLLSLDPDVILTQGLCDVCAVTPTTIEASLRGVQCTLPASCTVVTTTGTGMEGIFDDLRVIAKATNRSDVAEQLIGDSKIKLQQLNKLPAGTSILGLEWVDPFFSAGHWVPEQIEAIGATSAIGSPMDHSRTLSVEEIVESDPDIIIVLCCGFGLTENLKFAKKLYSMDGIKSLRAVQNERVWAIDANSFCSRPTIRVADGSVHMSDGLQNGNINGVLQQVHNPNR